MSGFKAGDQLLFGTVTGATLGAATTTTVSGDTVITETLSFADGTITATFDETVGKLSLATTSGTTAASDYQAALQAVAFTEAPNTDPTHGGTDNVRSVTWTVVDQNGANNTTTVTTTLDTVHKAPVVTAGVTVTYTEGQTGPTVLDNGFTVTDSDTLTSATVSVSGFKAGDDLLFGTVTLTTASGTAAASDYQAALQAVAFNEAANTDPTHGGTDTPRTVTWSVTDINPDTLHDSASASSTLKITHQAPIVSGVTGANAVVTYTEDRPDASRQWADAHRLRPDRQRHGVGVGLCERR